MTRKDVWDLLSNGGRKTDRHEVDRFVKAWKAGIPIMPVTFFCDFLKEWAGLYGAPLPGEENPEENKRRRELGEKIQHVFIQITKSNLLWRRIYRGQPVRTEPCPSHKGRWSGCQLAETTECKGACMDGSNVTGWLPVKKVKKANKALMRKP